MFNLKKNSILCVKWIGRNAVAFLYNPQNEFLSNGQNSNSKKMQFKWKFLFQIVLNVFDRCETNKFHWIEQITDLYIIDSHEIWFKLTHSCFTANYFVFFYKNNGLASVWGPQKYYIFKLTRKIFIDSNTFCLLIQLFLTLDRMKHRTLTTTKSAENEKLFENIVHK